MDGIGVGIGVGIVIDGEQLIIIWGVGSRGVTHHPGAERTDKTACRWRVGVDFDVDVDVDMGGWYGRGRGHGYGYGSPLPKINGSEVEVQFKKASWLYNIIHTRYRYRYIYISLSYSVSISKRKEKVFFFPTLLALQSPDLVNPTMYAFILCVKPRSAQSLRGNDRSRGSRGVVQRKNLGRTNRSVQNGKCGPSSFLSHQEEKDRRKKNYGGRRDAPQI